MTNVPDHLGRRLKRVAELRKQYREKHDLQSWFDQAEHAYDAGSLVLPLKLELRCPAGHYICDGELHRLNSTFALAPLDGLPVIRLGVAVWQQEPSSEWDDHPGDHTWRSLRHWFRCPSCSFFDNTQYVDRLTVEAIKAAAGRRSWLTVPSR